MSYGLIAAGIGTAISAGTGLYAQNQQKKAAGKQADALRSGTKQLEPILLGDPEQLDLRQISQDSVDIPYDKLEYASRLARSINRVNYGEQMRYYRKIQPFFDQIQKQVGKNALSFARGELPSDTISSIGRAAAERGVQGGFGYGSQGARGGGALGNLNLRNLGLTSLDLARYGTQIGMQVNQSARSLLPQLVSPTDYLLTPQQIMAGNQYNVGVKNDFAVRNNALQNNAQLQNTSLENSLNQTLAQMSYNGDVASAKMIAQIGQSLGGAVSGLGGSLGGAASSPSWTTTNTQADVIRGATNAGATPQPWYINARGLA